MAHNEEQNPAKLDSRESGPPLDVLSADLPSGGVSPPKTLKGWLHRYKHIEDNEASGGSGSKQRDHSNSPPLKSDLKTTQTRSSLKRESSEVGSSGPVKKERRSSSYAPPTKYAHLKHLTDILEPNLILVFCGLNPGVATATAGHAYAHRTNKFWPLLHSSGLTDRLLKPEEDVDLPRLYTYGNTNIVARPSKDQAELSKSEMVAGTPILEEKFRKFKPEAVCLVGKGIWEAVYKYKQGKNLPKAEFHYGWQDEKFNMGGAKGELDDEGKPWKGTRVFVASSTSGLAASLSQQEKEDIWKPLGDWASQRRRERMEKTATTETE